MKKKKGKVFFGIPTAEDNERVRKLLIEDFKRQKELLIEEDVGLESLVQLTEILKKKSKKKR